jgi:hypothetical protein
LRRGAIPAVVGVFVGLGGGTGVRVESKNTNTTINNISIPYTTMLCWFLFMLFAFSRKWGLESSI